MSDDPVFVQEVAKAMCSACGENPLHAGDCRGNDHRWQDYMEPAMKLVEILGAGFATRVKNPWKQAVLDQLICQCIYSREHESNPWKAVHDMTSWEVAVALDPRVSDAARELIFSHGGYTSAGPDDIMETPEIKTEDKSNGST